MTEMLSPAQLLVHERDLHAKQLRQLRAELLQLQTAYRAQLNQHRAVLVQMEQLMPYLRPVNAMFAFRRTLLVDRIQNTIRNIDEFAKRSNAQG